MYRMYIQGKSYQINSQAVALYKSLLEYKINWKITINIDAPGKYLPKTAWELSAIQWQQWDIFY